jgi:hypothetical protein
LDKVVGKYFHVMIVTWNTGLAFSALSARPTLPYGVRSTSRSPPQALPPRDGPARPSRTSAGEQKQAGQRSNRTDQGRAEPLSEALESKMMPTIASEIATSSNTSYCIVYINIYKTLIDVTSDACDGELGWTMP